MEQSFLYKYAILWTKLQGWAEIKENSIAGRGCKKGFNSRGCSQKEEPSDGVFRDVDLPNIDMEE